MSDFKKGDRVRFMPGPRATAKVSAEVLGPSECGRFLITKDGNGKERKVRPGACKKL